MTTQQAVLDFITRYRTEHLYGPTLDEIADEVGMSKSGVYYQVRQMEADGLIERDANIGRSIRVRGA